MSLELCPFILKIEGAAGYLGKKNNTFVSINAQNPLYTQ